MYSFKIKSLIQTVRLHLRGFKYSYLTQIIFKQIFWPTSVTLIDTTTSDKSGSGSNVATPYTPELQNWNLTTGLILVSYPLFWGGVFSPFAEDIGDRANTNSCITSVFRYCHAIFSKLKDLIVSREILKQIKEKFENRLSVFAGVSFSWRFSSGDGVENCTEDEICFVSGHKGKIF